MIAVAARPADLAILGELFELFKTPWEPAVPGRRYRCVLSVGEAIENLDAECFFVYASALAGDRDAQVTRLDGPLDLEWGTTTLPIYGRIAVFEKSAGRATLRYRGNAVDDRPRAGSSRVWRIGYDLAHEVRHLLTEGQPASHAMVPTLDRHIELLRHLLHEAGIPFVEVLPRPHGRDFICCLTHDVDFFGIRRHGFDLTMAGFIARATVGTLWDLIRGRRTAAEARRNLTAALSLPFVFLRLLPDFWHPFEDYERAEGTHPATFFLVPVKGRAGVSPEGIVDRTRAVPYQVSEIRDAALQCAQRGNELAVHGVDAWRDPAAGRAELQELTQITGRATSGVRMHWLYFDQESPRQLEAAGFTYDSTCGYNEAVGYRAGTSQVFRWPSTEDLMELPLSIMDSALFLRDRMDLPRGRALELCRRIVAHARTSGGTLVINWHERSLAPERLWDDAYRQLLDEVEQGGRAWFATSEQAVRWFRWRRSIAFTSRTARTGTSTGVAVSAAGAIDPGGVIRVHEPGPRGVETRDIPFDGRIELDIDLAGGSVRESDRSREDRLEMTL